MASSKFTGTFTPGAGIITDEHVSSSAAIDVTKQKHAYCPRTNFATAIGATPATREEIVWVANAAGTIRGFHALLNDTGTSTSITFDLKKNGTTMLSSVITITHSIADKAVQDGTLSVTSFAADDILSISMTVSSSTGAQGPAAWIALSENDAP